MKVSATLKGRPDALGRRAIYIRVNDGLKRVSRSTNIRVLPKDWDKKVLSSDPQAKMKNNAIKLAILRKESALLNGSPDQKDVDFFVYCNQCVGSWEWSKKTGTIKQYWSQIAKAKRFVSVLRISQVTPEFLNSYAAHLRIIEKNEINTIWSSMKFMRTIMNQAYKQKLIAANPFHIFKMPRYKDPQIAYLTKQQVDAIEDYSLQEKCPRELKFVAAWFLIACWTGLRFSDCRAFDKKQIKGNRITVYTEKTYEPVSFPLTERLKSLLDRVDCKPLHFTNEYVNRMLKVIAEMCELKPLTFHQSRHTFGTLAASAGMRREVIAKLMGHTDLRSTAIYAKLTNPVLDSEYEKLK